MTAPNGWLESTLGDVAKSIRNGLFARRPNDEGRGTAILRISAVKAGRVDVLQPRFVEGVTDDQVEKFTVEPGDLLITRYNGSRHLVGVSGIVPEHAGPVLHPDKLIRVVVDVSEVDPRFLNYQLQSPRVRSFLEPRIRTTAGQSGISGHDVREVPLVVPPLVEQRRIAEILEDHLSRLDAAHRSLDVQPDRLDLVRLSRMQLVREQLVRDGAETRKIRDVAETALGKMLDAKRAAGTSTPYLRNVNVRWGRVDATNVAEVPLTADERQRFALRQGDILVCEGGEPGRSAVWTGSESLMAYQKALHRIRVNVDVIEPEFLALMLEYVIRSGQADRLFTGTTIKHLPQEKLRQIEIPVPVLNVQQAVVADLRELDAIINRLRSELIIASRRAERLRRSLLAAAFSGQLTGASSDVDRVDELAEAGV